MEKETQEEGVWVPKTPAKSIPAREGPVSDDREWKNHVGGSSSAWISQDSTDFHARASVDSMDAAPAKEEIGSEFDLNRTPYELGFSDLNNGYCEEVLAGKQGRLMGFNPCENSSKLRFLNGEKSQLSAFSTPSEKGNTSGRHKDDEDLNKQSRKKHRRKKYWPKVVVEVNKTPKPSTPKPRTPKPRSHTAISKRGSDEKRKCAEKNSFHVSTKPSRDLGLDGQAIDASSVSESENRAWSCVQKKNSRASTRRALNFNLQDHERDCAKDARIMSSSGTELNEQGKEGNESSVKNSSGSLKVYQRRFRVNQCQSNSRKLGPNFPNMCKKRRTGRRKARVLSTFVTAKDGEVRQNIYMTGYVTLQSIIAAEDRQRIFKKRTRRKNPTKFCTWQPIRAAENEQNGVKTSNFSLGNHGAQLATQFNTKDDLAGVESYSMICYSAIANCYCKVPKKKRSNKSSRRLNLGSSTLTPTCNQLRSASLTQVLNGRVWNQEIKRCPGYPFPTLENVIKKLEGLHITDQGGQLVVQNENAYGKVGEGKAIILYNSRKRKPLPKVDIDQETMREWKLLMANQGEDVEEERDKEKEKWWEEQRKIFRGRIDSFIARMHLIQGDRRFSPWKGSVVDSVVGVFLTQNVSDHLSSSAFMSLAAKYPNRSTTNYRACNEDKGIVYSHEPIGSNTRAIVQDECSPQDFMDSLIDGDPSSTCKHSKIARSSGCTKIVHLEETTCLQEFSTCECGELLGNESLDDYNISGKLEDEKKGSSSNRLFDVNGTRASVCQPGSQNPYSFIPLTPSDLEVESGKILAGFTKTTMVGCVESFDIETIVQQEVTPIDQKATFDLCASLSKCQVLPECSSQAEVNQAEGWCSSKNHQGGSKIILQTRTRMRKNKIKIEEKQDNTIDWDDLRKTYAGGRAIEATSERMDSLDWEGVRQATVAEVADAIKGRGQHRVLAERIKDFLDRVVRDHGSINLEWLRGVPPDKAKDYLLSFKGLGLKSVECVRLLTLHHHAFPVDTNVGRVAVRLGWVPLRPLPESLQIHLLEQYPLLDAIQVYLWPRLCTLDQRTLYELHYQMITFGKVFCRKRKPNCNACPMRGECRHFASAFASARLALPGPQKKSMVASMVPDSTVQNSVLFITPATESPTEAESRYQTKNCEPIIEYPQSPKLEPIEDLERDIEDCYDEFEDEIPIIRLDTEKFQEKLWECVGLKNTPSDMSKALVALTSEAASIPVPKLKEISRLRTIHHVYELHDSHSILAGFDKREPDDPCPYLLAIWNSGDTAISSKPFRQQCEPEGSQICNENACFSCNNIQDQSFQTVCGTVLIPCRTATRGSFPLNGTYFQVNEVFADDETSQHPLNVPREWIWDLRRRTLYCGANVSAIFRGLSTAEIQSCFWRGYVCVRAFNRKTRVPAYLSERFHISTSPRAKRKFTPDE